MGLSPYAVGCKYVSPGAVPALGSLLQDPLGWKSITYHTEHWLSASGAVRCAESAARWDMGTAARPLPWLGSWGWAETRVGE